MSEAAKQFLRSFKELSQVDQHDVLVSWLRLPIDAVYTPPADDELLQAADQIFLGLDEAENAQ